MANEHDSISDSFFKECFGNTDAVPILPSYRWLQR